MRRALLAGLFCAPALATAQTLPSGVARPIQQAEHLVALHHDQAALAKLQEAKNAAGADPTALAIIDQVSGAASADAQDYSAAATAYQAALATGQIPPSQRLALQQGIAVYDYQAGNFPASVTYIQKYAASGGQDARILGLLPQAEYQEGDFAAASRDAAAQIAKYTEAGQTPPAGLSELRLAAAQKSGDPAAYQSALLASLDSNPTPNAWETAIDQVTALPDFPDALALDVYRLRLATGTLSAPRDYEDYAERAILSGQNQEAKLVIQQGFAKGILNSSTDEGHAGRLLTRVSADPEPPGPFKPQPGADTLEAGIGDLQAGNKPLAAEKFQRVQQSAPGSPEAALAQLWAVLATSKQSLF